MTTPEPTGSPTPARSEMPTTTPDPSPSLSPAAKPSPNYSPSRTTSPSPTISPTPTPIPTPLVVVSTLAGTGTPGPTGGFADGEGNTAMFDHPRDIGIDPNGSLWVVDAGNSSIRRVYLDGRTETITKTFAPQKVTVAESGEVFYVSYSYCSQIRQLLFGQEKVQEKVLAGDCPDGYVDGPGGMARFRAIGDILVDKDGSIIVSEYGNHRLRRLTQAGVVSTVAGDGVEGYRDGGGGVARFNMPLGLARGANGEIFIADNSRIRKLANGVVSTVSGTGEFGGQDGPSSSATFREAANIAMMPDYKTLVVAEPFKIRQVNLFDGSVRTIAGGDTSGFVEGFGPAARFATITGVAVGSDGTIFVSDLENHRIRKIVIREPDLE